MGQTETSTFKCQLMKFLHENFGKRVTKQVTYFLLLSNRENTPTTDYFVEMSKLFFRLLNMYKYFD